MNVSQYVEMGENAPMIAAKAPTILESLNSGQFEVNGFEFRRSFRRLTQVQSVEAASALEFRPRRHLFVVIQ